MAEDTAVDYSVCLDILNSENVVEVEEFTKNVDAMLTSLDAYCSIVDIVRSDTALCLGTTLPEIHKKSKQLKTIFGKIDQLTNFVEMVGKQVNETEQILDQAEQQYGSVATFKKLLTALPKISLFGSASSPPQAEAKPAIRPKLPQVFHTGDYISSPSVSPSREASSSLEPSPLHETPSLETSPPREASSLETSPSHTVSQPQDTPSSLPHITNTS